MRIPQLVAHRGYAACFPENTLLSMAKAVESGARFLECDVQLCADGTPVLFHDASLERTTGVQKNLLDCSYATVQSLDTCERSKFGERFVGQGLTIPALADFITFLKSVPQVRTFIELKNESLRRHGVDAVLDIVFPIIQPAFKQCILIAYDAQVLRAARKRGVHQCGWVLTTWDNASHQEAKILAPDILISNHKKIPSETTPFWAGPWEWCFYEVTAPEKALALHARGADFIETMDIGGILKDPRLRRGGVFDDAAL